MGSIDDKIVVVLHHTSDARQGRHNSHVLVDMVYLRYNQSFLSQDHHGMPCISHLYIEATVAHFSSQRIKKNQRLPFPAIVATGPVLIGP